MSNRKERKEAAVSMQNSGDLDALARLVLLSWKLDEEPERVDIGLNKATWRVGCFWLSSDFASTNDQVARLEDLLDRVAAEFGSDIAVPKFVPSSAGPIVEASGRVWWVTRNVTGRHPDSSDESDMEAVARGLALMHKGLSRVPREYAVSDDTCEGLFLAGERLVSDDRLGFTPDDLETAREATAVVFKNLDAIRRPGMQITHGDPSNPNLFVGGSSLQLVGAIDWDYARFDLVMSDVATMAQTILFRSETDRPREYLEDVLGAYMAAGGLKVSTEEVLVGVIMVLFEAIAHHGNRYILGQGDYDRVGGRVDNIRTVLGLMAG
jgi:Ser/Thr protein kinase RdoA (MazF antagonist)